MTGSKGGKKLRRCKPHGTKPNKVKRGNLYKKNGPRNRAYWDLTLVDGRPAYIPRTYNVGYYIPADPQGYRPTERLRKMISVQEKLKEQYERLHRS